MADIKFSEFPKATISKDSDELAILQDGVNKMIPSPVLESKIINKTVSRVIQQGGASLNVINLKGVVPTYADLALITPTPELNDAYQVEADGLVYVYTDTGFQADGDGFVVQPQPTGVVEEGNTQAVSGGEVYDAIPKVKEKSLFNKNSKYLVEGVVIASNGNYASSPSYEGAVALIDFPLQPNTTYSLSGYVPNSNKRLCLADSNGVVDAGSIVLITNSTTTFTTDSDYHYLRCQLKRANSVETDTSWEDNIMLIEGSEASTSKNAVTDINGVALEAKALSVNNIVPTPVYSENAVNKEYFDNNAVKESDFETIYSTNLFDTAKIINDKYVSSTGSIANVSGWQMILIDIELIADLSDITFGRLFMSNPSYWAMYSTKDVDLIGSPTKISNGAFSAGQVVTVEKPLGALSLGITIKRPANDVSVYEEGTVNIGSDLLAYEPYYRRLSKIKGYEIQGRGDGESYNQSLNTTDEVEFAKVVAPIETSVLVLNLPTSASGLPTGRCWIDESNGNVIKVV